MNYNILVGSLLLDTDFFRIHSLYGSINPGPMPSCIEHKLSLTNTAYTIRFFVFQNMINNILVILYAFNKQSVLHIKRLLSFLC